VKQCSEAKEIVGGRERWDKKYVTTEKQQESLVSFSFSFELLEDPQQSANGTKEGGPDKNKQQTIKSSQTKQ